MPNARSMIGAAFVAIAGLAAAGRAVPRAQESPPELTLRMIVVTTAEAAGRLAARLSAGESFVRAAQAESIAPSAPRGGWLGRLRVADLRPEVRAALEGLRPGQLSPVVRIPTGFAIFKVEPPEAAVAGTAKPPANPMIGGPADWYEAALTSTGAVNYVFDVGGVSEERSGLTIDMLPPGWADSSRILCEARVQTRAATREAVAAFVASDNQDTLEAADPLDVVQLHFGVAQLHAYEGDMDAAIAAYGRGREVAAARFPEALLQFDQALGVAHLHKAFLDHDQFSHPGDLCLLDGHTHAGLADPVDARRAAEYFLAYLDQRPDDLEVRWLLNLAHRAMGTYPDGVPSEYLVPLDRFASAEGVGRFRDVAREAGLVSVESAGGLVVEDLDGDADLDVITSTVDSCGTMRLFLNNGDGTFTNRTAGSGLDLQLGGLNVVPGDYDNDACTDLLLLRGGWESLPQRVSLLRNNCDGTFTDVTVESGLAAPIASQTAAWTDVDHDGLLDLFVGNETGPARLYRNRGDGTITDNPAAAAMSVKVPSPLLRYRRAGVDGISFTKGVAAADYDNDGFPDLFASNFGERHFLYRNNGDGTFTESAEAARVVGPPTAFATWFFDYDNDGWQDLFVTSFVTSVAETVRDYLGLPRNGNTARLYRNTGDGAFRDVTAEVGLDHVLMPMGANFGDIDNDGFLDIYLGTGHPSYGALVPSALLRNDEGRRFVDVTASSGTGELHKGHGVAFADLDRDGDEDLIFEVGGAVPGDRHAMRLFENPGNGRDWIDLTLAGVRTNRSAIGARITVTVRYDDGRTRAMHRSVGTGGSFGASPLSQHVGLGAGVDTVDVEIWWPASGTRQRFTNVAPNQALRIEELDESYTTIARTPVRLGGAEARP